MNREGLGMLAAMLVLMMLLQGCATFSTISRARPETPMLFSGTRLDVHALADNRAALRRFPVKPPKYPLLDLPFSIVFDAFLLPLTIPVASYEAVFE